MSAITELEFINDTSVGKLSGIIYSFRDIGVDTELIIDRNSYPVLRLYGITPEGAQDMLAEYRNEHWISLVREVTE